MIQYKTIIKTFGNGKIEDFLLCNCMLDDLLSILLSTKEISYNEIISKFEEKKPNGFIFLKFYNLSILICKNSFLQYTEIRKDNFLNDGCCPELLKINSEFLSFCLICFIKDVTSNLNLKFFEHFRLVDQFRDNDVFIYMQLPIRTFDENFLLLN